MHPSRQLNVYNWNNISKNSDLNLRTLLPIIIKKGDREIVFSDKLILRNSWKIYYKDEKILDNLDYDKLNHIYVINHELMCTPVSINNKKFITISNIDSNMKLVNLIVNIQKWWRDIYYNPKSKIFSKRINRYFNSLSKIHQVLKN